MRDRDGGQGSPWRGNTSSAAVQFWAHLALTRSGRPADAKVAGNQLGSLVEQEGFRSWYDALSGEGGGSEGVALNAILLEMAAG